VRGKAIKSVLKDWIGRGLVAVADRLDYHVEPKLRCGLRRPVPSGAKLYVGCGEDEQAGYLGCDLRPLEHVALVCRAWEVSTYCTGLSEIYTRHMLEHLSWDEAQVTLRDWHRALHENGTLRIEVPNIRFAIDQWLRAAWSEEALENRFSDARWGFAGLFGWQRECNPASADYNATYWDAHKSGYDEHLLRFLLQRNGFEQIRIWTEGFTEKQMRRRKLPPGASDGCHLMATAVKAPAAAAQAA
jgi:predicted SAM-dependent methyltransferase